MMDNQVSDAETWNLGDIIKDNTNKEWKLVKVGSGETRSHKDSENQLVYDNVGGELVVLQFSEPTKKVKKGKKWELVEGAKEHVIIKLMDNKYTNLSEAVRQRINERKLEESLFSTEIDPSVIASFVADRSTIASSIATSVSTLTGWQKRLRKILL